MTADPDMTAYTLLVPGEPTGKGRPLFVRATGRAITPAKTRLAENRIYLAWVEAGQPRFPDGPLGIDVVAALERPRGHYRTSGALALAGQRLPWPTKRPDWDNLAKLAADALNGNGYHDDAQIVRASVEKRWARADEQAHTRITVYQLDTALTLERAA